MRTTTALVLLWSVPVWAAGAGAAGAAPGSAEGTYKQLELFARVLSYVENNYVEPVDDQQLMYGAIKGMLDTLDPHTVFMPPDVFKEMKIDTSGEFGGLGIEIAKKNDVITAALGEHISQHFLAAKRQEWREYITQVSQWELDNYLAKY